MNKHIKKEVKEYIKVINESIEYEAYETASMQAENLSKFLVKLSKETIRYCTEHEYWEEK